jgi:hypothetical protein
MPRLRDVLPLWRVERALGPALDRMGLRLPGDDAPVVVDPDFPGAAPPVVELLRALFAMPAHRAGSLMPLTLRAIARHASARRIRHSAETGTGKSTILLSHLSEHHTVFALGEGDGSMEQARSRLLRADRVEWVLGPSQRTLPRHAFAHRLQLALIDGPHGYPFPELEYYFLYPQLDEDALLIVDDINIPTVHRLYTFLLEEPMFAALEVVGNTAFFRRTGAPTFDPLGDGWWNQPFNNRRHPVPESPRRWIEV